MKFANRWRIAEIVRTRIVPLYEGHLFHAGLQRVPTTAKLWFDLSLLHVHRPVPKGLTVVDLGAGLSYFGPLLFSLGMDASIVDDFAGGGGVASDDPQPSAAVIQRFAAMGVQVIPLDLLSSSLPFASGTVDIVTCFHSLEHWHHSPRRLFHEIHRILKPGGLLVLNCPNAVNLRNRVRVVLGITNLCPFREWYCDGDPIFRGHVREATIQELRDLCAWNNLRVTRFAGRNFDHSAREERSFWAGALHGAGRAFETLLQIRAGWCSDIYVCAVKEQAEGSSDTGDDFEEQR